MSKTPSASARSGSMNRFRFEAWHVAIAIVGAITLARIVTLVLSPLNLSGDEAQYWDWSRAFAFGYFSKPPLIAWIIGLTTSVCGDGEACVRVSAPLFHMGTSLILFQLAKRLFDQTTALWTAITFCLLPGISFSSGIMTTDVPLLFFWSLSLWFLHIALERDRLAWDIALGVAIGLGFLAKYAMIYFLVGMVVMVLFARSAHLFVRTQKALVVLGIIAVFLLPNLLWNLQNDFSTVSHTAANANWNNSAFRLSNVADFLGDQIALFGPFLFIAFLFVLGAVIRNAVQRQAIDDRYLLLISFAVPALAIVIVQSFISRAHGNWAAVAYPAATILVVHFLIAGWRRYVLYATTALHAVFAAGFYILATHLPLVDDLGLDNAFKRVRGWPELVAEIGEVSKNQALYTLVFDDRMMLTEYLYYAREARTTALVWDHDNHPGNHYEFTRPLKTPTREPMLLVTRQRTPAPILAAFEQNDYIGEISVSKGGDRQRRVHLFIVHGFDGR